MDVSRRGFLGAVASVPFAGAKVRQTLSAAAGGSTCALPESRAGFAQALAGRDAPDVLVFPGAAGWDDSIERRVRSGRLVIFESASGFTDTRARREQCSGLKAAFGLIIEHPITMWSEGRRPSYVDFGWPVPVLIRDFSFAVPVRGGEAVGRLGALPVATLQRAGAGALLFLGSPVGPALWSGDPQAHAWLSSVLAVTRSRGGPGSAGRS